MAISGTFADGDQIPLNDCEIEVDLTASGSWANIDSWSSQIDLSGGDTPVSRLYLFTSDVVIYPGNRNPWQVTVTCAYTEGSTDPFENIWDRYESSPGAVMEVRWAPGGDGAGGYLFTTSGGRITSCTAPTGSADGNEASMFSFTIEASSIARGTES